MKQKYRFLLLLVHELELSAIKQCTKIFSSSRFYLHVSFQRGETTTRLLQQLEDTGKRYKLKKNMKLC